MTNESILQSNRRSQFILYREFRRYLRPTNDCVLRSVPTTVPPAQNYQNTRISHLWPDFFYFSFHFFFFFFFDIVVTILFLIYNKLDPFLSFANLCVAKQTRDNILIRLKGVKTIKKITTCIWHTRYGRLSKFGHKIKYRFVKKTSRK